MNFDEAKPVVRYLVSREWFVTNGCVEFRGPSVSRIENESGGEKRRVRVFAVALVIVAAGVVAYVLSRPICCSKHVARCGRRIMRAPLMRLLRSTATIRCGLKPLS